MTLKLGKSHPDYSFDPYIKSQIYEAIFKAIGNKKISHAVTFPGLAGFKFELELIRRCPGIQITCFESDIDIYNAILQTWRLPKNIHLRNSVAEEWMSRRKSMYDLIFFDFCGGSTYPLSELVPKWLKTDGLYAQTLYTGRGHYKAYSKVRHPLLIPAIRALHYQHMKFNALRKVAEEFQPALKITLDSTRVLSPRNRSVQSGVQLRDYVSKKKESARHETRRDIQRKERLQVRHSQFDSYFEDGSIRCLSPKELQALTLYKAGKFQQEIAKELGMTQGAVVYLLKRAVERMQSLKEFPVLSIIDIKSLTEHFEQKYIDVMITMGQTTCQSETAEILNERGYKGLDQVKVRYIWKTLLHQIAEAVKLNAGGAYLQRTLDYMNYVDNHLYIFHQVKLPHFERLQAVRRIENGSSWNSVSADVYKRQSKISSGELFGTESFNSQDMPISEAVAA